MQKLKKEIARQIADAAGKFQEQLTGHAPQSVSVVMDKETLFITLHGALSPAEKVLAQSAEGASKVQEFHRQLFAASADILRKEIQRITGLQVLEAAAEVEPAGGTVVHAFSSGTMIQVFQLGTHLPEVADDGVPPGRMPHESGNSVVAV